MTADRPGGWWGDDSDEDSFGSGGLAKQPAAGASSGNPISGVPAGGSPWPGESPTGSAPTGTNLTTADLTAADPTTADPTAADLTAESRRSGPAANSALAHPGRLALGMVALAAERLRLQGTASTAFVTGVGLVAQAAEDTRALARRAAGPPVRVATIAVAVASTLPGAELPRRSLARSRDLLRRVAGEARRRGEAALAAGRADASSFIQTNVAGGIAWAQANAVPQIVDGLVPHLIADTMPRIIDGAMPEIRDRVLPVMIEDLTKDPRVRDLVVEQGRGVVGEAAQQLRATTATADDRVESAFRRLVRSPNVADESPGAETTSPLGHG